DRGPALAAPARSVGGGEPAPGRSACNGPQLRAVRGAQPQLLQSWQPQRQRPPRTATRPGRRRLLTYTTTARPAHLRAPAGQGRRDGGVPLSRLAPLLLLVAAEVEGCGTTAPMAVQHDRIVLVRRRRHDAARLHAARIQVAHHLDGSGPAPRAG